MANKPHSSGADDGEFTVSADETGKDGTQKTGPKKWMVLLLFVGVPFLIFAIWEMFSPSHQAAPTSAATTTAGSTSQGSTLSAGVPGQQASVAALGSQANKLEKQVEALQQQLAAIPAADKQAQQDLEDRLNQKLNELSQQIADDQNKQVEAERNGVAAGGNNATAGTGVAPSGAPGAVTSGPAFPYHTLFSNSGTSPAAGPSRPASSGGLLSGLPPVSFTPAGESAVSQNNGGSTSVGNGGAAGLQTAGSAQTPAAGTSIAALAAAHNQKTGTIPALSFVRVTLLHGVSCPVPDSSLVSGGSGSGILGSENVPVVMPVNGEWHGPNGHTYTLGHAHLYGLCTGQETEDRATAIVKIERLSYVGPDNVPQDIPINGYVIDQRDNAMGIRGTLESVKAQQIADASTAAAIASLGSIGTQASTTTSLNPIGGTTSVINPGGTLKAAAGSGFAAGANMIAQYWAQRAAQSVDVVAVPSGVPLIIINTDPIIYANGPANTSAVASSDPPY